MKILFCLEDYMTVCSTRPSRCILSCHTAKLDRHVPSDTIHLLTWPNKFLLLFFFQGGGGCLMIACYLLYCPMTRSWLLGFYYEFLTLESSCNISKPSHGFMSEGRVHILHTNPIFYCPSALSEGRQTAGCRCRMQVAGCRCGLQVAGTGCRLRLHFFQSEDSMIFILYVSTKISSRKSELFHL